MKNDPCQVTHREETPARRLAQRFCTTEKRNKIRTFSPRDGPSIALVAADDWRRSFQLTGVLQGL